MSLLLLVPGLFFLLVGLKIMRNGLENAADRWMGRALQSLTGSPLAAMITGAVITALVQSSTAITVLTIGFVNAGVLNLVQAVGIILGANIGTCITSQLLSFNLTALALPSMAAGVVFLIPGQKRAAFLNTAHALLGFGMIFLGLEAISASFVPLRSSVLFTNLLSSLSGRHLLAVLAGLAFTGLVHSSATTTGVVVALSRQGLLDLESAIALVLGGNIGTCITALLASISSTAAGKRAAAAHVILNLGGVLLFLPFLHPFSSLIGLTDPSLPRQVSNAQTIFNIACSLAVLPFIRGFARLLNVLVREP